MEQFSLEKYLENPSRKVVTRRENSVRIICTDRKHGEDNLPIVFLEECLNGEFLLTCRNDGRNDNYDTQYDLFFADEEEELTEFEKCVQAVMMNCGLIGCHENYKDIDSVKSTSKTLLDLARKELEENYYTKVLDDRMVFKSELHATDVQTAYDMGKQDALKDLPKWKKTQPCEKYIHNKGYYITWTDLEKLPKEQ